VICESHHRSDESNLKTAASEHIRYYHEDRTHLGLGRGTPRTADLALYPQVASFLMCDWRVTPPVRSGSLIRTNGVAKTSGFLPFLY